MLYGHVCVKWMKRKTAKKEKKIQLSTLLRLHTRARKCSRIKSRERERQRKRKSFYFPFQHKTNGKHTGFFFCFLLVRFVQIFYFALPSTTLLAFLCQLEHIMWHCYGANVNLCVWVDENLLDTLVPNARTNPPIDCDPTKRPPLPWCSMCTISHLRNCGKVNRDLNTTNDCCSAFYYFFVWLID